MSGPGRAKEGAAPAEPLLEKIWEGAVIAREEAARLEGYGEAEEMIVEGLRKFAEAEDVKALAVHEAWCRFHTPALGIERDKHANRAACLREAALAVSVGQFRDVPKGE